jgi:hypothetical protein
VLAVAFGKKYGDSRPINVIFVYMAQAFERELAVAFGKKNSVVSNPTTSIFLYVAQAVEQVPAVAFGKKYKVFRVPLTAYFFL